MIDVSDIITDPDVVQSFQVSRMTGDWVNGRFTQTSTQTLPMSGTIIPGTPKDVQMTPSGDQIMETITVYTTDPLYTTERDPAEGTANKFCDVVVWKGENYKVLQVKNYSDYGYYRSIGTRKRGA